MQNALNRQFEFTAFSFSDELKEFTRQWGWVLTLGILLVVAGALAVTSAFQVTMATVMVFGTLATIGGFFNVVNAFVVTRWRGFALHFFFGLLYIAVGIYMLTTPMAAAAAVGLVLSVALIFSGCMRIVFAISEKFQGWGWTMISGVIALLFGISLAMEWPSSAFWVIGLFVGIDLMLVGWGWVVRALVLRKIEHLNAKA